MRAYLPAETMPSWLLLLECIEKRSPCDRNTDDVTAVWYYKHVNKWRAVYFVMVSQVIQQEESDISSQTGGAKARLALCESWACVCTEKTVD